jgi:hypothetical protein
VQKPLSSSSSTSGQERLSGQQQLQQQPQQSGKKKNNHNNHNGDGGGGGSSRSSSSNSSTTKGMWPSYFNPWIGTIQMWPGPGGQRPAASPASAGYAGRRSSIRSSTTGRADLHDTTRASAHSSWSAAGSSTTGSGNVISMDGSWDQQSLANSFNTMSMVPPAVIDWVADSSASNHTTSDVSNLTYIRPPHTNAPSSIIVGNGSSLPVTSVGDTTLLSPFYLNNVLVTPDII